MGHVRNLRAEYLRRRLDYDPATGAFRWRAVPGDGRIINAWNAKHVGKVAGALRPDGYVKITIDGKSYLAHRLAWLHVTGEWPEDEVDHRDGLSNRFNNLREATSGQNKTNKGVRPDNKIGLKGVIRDKNSYRAQIGHAGVRWAIGHYKTPEEAHAAYREVAAKLHGEFARAG